MVLSCTNCASSDEALVSKFGKYTVSFRDAARKAFGCVDSERKIIKSLLDDESITAVDATDAATNKGQDELGQVNELTPADAGVAGIVQEKSAEDGGVAGMEGPVVVHAIDGTATEIVDMGALVEPSVRDALVESCVSVGDDGQSIEVVSVTSDPPSEDGDQRECGSYVEAPTKLEDENKSVAKSVARSVAKSLTKSMSKLIPKSDEKSVAKSVISAKKSVRSAKTSDAQSVNSAAKSVAKSVNSTRNSDARSVKSAARSVAESVNSAWKSDTQSVKNAARCVAKSVNSAKKSNTQSVKSVARSVAKSVNSVSKSDAKSVGSAALASKPTSGSEKEKSEEASQSGSTKMRETSSPAPVDKRDDKSIDKTAATMVESSSDDEDPAALGEEEDRDGALAFAKSMSFQESIASMTSGASADTRAFIRKELMRHREMVRLAMMVAAKSDVPGAGSITGSLAEDSIPTGAE